MATAYSVAASYQPEGMQFLQPSECLDSPGKGLPEPQPSAKGVKLNENSSAKPAPTKSGGGSQPQRNTWLNSGLCWRKAPHFTLHFYPYSPHPLLKASSREETLSQPGKT